MPDLYDVNPHVPWGLLARWALPLVLTVIALVLVQLLPTPPERIETDA